MLKYNNNYHAPKPLPETLHSLRRFTRHLLNSYIRMGTRLPVRTGQRGIFGIFVRAALSCFGPVHCAHFLFVADN